MGYVDGGRRRVRLVIGLAVSSLALAMSIAGAAAADGFPSPEAFGPHQSYAVGTDPAAITIAALGNDKKPDVITANAGSNDVSILLARGKGKFAPQVRISVGDEPSGLAVADLNGDGRLDVVTANAGSNDVSVLLARKNGKLLPERRFAVGAEPLTLAIADIDGDGTPDLVLGTDSGVVILDGRGNGSFAAPQAASIPPPPEFTFVGFSKLQVGDVNGDGKSDLVTVAESEFSGRSQVAVALGKGNGSFGAFSSFDVQSFVDEIAVADIDGDGNLDLATSSTYFRATPILVLRGDGNGAFEVIGGYGIDAPLGVGLPSGTTFADMDGDGILDLVTAGGSSLFGGDFHVFPGIGDGAFGASVNFSLDPGKFAVGDLDRNGLGDVATVSGPNGITVYFREASAGKRRSGRT